MREYTLKRSARRTLALEITPELTVLVRAPLGLPKRNIDQFVLEQDDWITRHIEKQRLRVEAGPPELEPEDIEALKKQALEFLPGRVEHYSRLMGLYPSGVKITGAKKRFGSCSGKNSLCFSYRLMLYPPEAIDLVVVHELAHIRHKNHGPDFYACIAAVLPDHKRRKKLLGGKV